jgi:hypothetical protein
MQSYNHHPGFRVSVERYCILPQVKDRRDFSPTPIGGHSLPRQLKFLAFFLVHEGNFPCSSMTKIPVPGIVS